PAPGLFSSFGLLFADVEHHYVRTWRRRARSVEPSALADVLARMEAEARTQLAAEGFTGAAVRIRRSADCRYEGQSFELTVPVAGGPVEPSTLAGLDEAFGREHERTYGHRAGPDEPVEIVSLRVVGQGIPDRPRVPDVLRVDRSGPGSAGHAGRAWQHRHRAGARGSGDLMEPVRDPIAFELFRNTLLSIADEMALTILRTAYSGVLRDNMDYSTAFCDGSGRTVAQGLTLPAHLSSFPDALAATIARYGDRMKPGDVYCLNDPFEGGMHIPDVFVLKPIFFEGERLAFAATICHQTDMGGRVAGSNASDSTEIYQE